MRILQAGKTPYMAYFCVESNVKLNLLIYTPTRRLKFFGLIVREHPTVDHNRAIAACLNPLPANWNRPSGCLRHTWIRTVESDDAALDIGPGMDYRRARNRTKEGKGSLICTYDALL